MAKENDQPKETDEPKGDVAQDDAAAAAEAAEKEEQAAAVAKATKTSDKFDELIDTEGPEDVEETPPKGTGDDDKDKGDKKEPKDVEETPPEEDASKQTPVPDAKAAGDEPPEVKVSEEIAKKAIELGLTEEEIAGFDDDAAATKTLDIIQGIIDSEEEPAQAQGAQTPAQEPAETPPVGADAKKGEPFKVTFKNKDDIDPELLANLEGMEKHHQAEVKALRDQVEGLLGRLHQEDTDRFMGRFDGMVEKLGHEFEDVLGKGKTTQLSRRGTATQNRRAIRVRMHAFAKGLNDAGQEIPGEQELFDIAINSLHGNKMKNVQGLRLHKKTSARGKQAIGRGATKRAGSPTPHQKAVETSRKFDDLIDTTED